MSFRVGIHYKDGTKDYSREGDNWPVIKQWAAMASRDSEVAQTVLNCGGITQQIYVSGRPQWNSQRLLHSEIAARCSHGNHHE